jgi:hypothetical protein
MLRFGRDSKYDNVLEQLKKDNTFLDLMIDGIDKPMIMYIRDTYELPLLDSKHAIREISKIYHILRPD